MKSVVPEKRFRTKLLSWFKENGRHDLPWQSPRSPYYVWLSEIMLQQTQVATVLPYFERFVKRFPTLTSLALADMDDVLHLWSGLGYYARGRNLHKSAVLILEKHQGVFPDSFDDIIALPGIGRSTAAAILSQSFLQPAAILDGNVKRVLTRIFTIAGAPNDKKTNNLLWETAEKLIPKDAGEECCHYTQAIMDLGATICTRTKPKCLSCPVKEICLAYKTNTISLYPTKKISKTKPVKQTLFWIIQYQNAWLLHKRPLKGIWGGLWSFLESTSDKKLALSPHPKIEALESDRHTFTHYHLDYTPIVVKITNLATKKQLDTLLEKQEVKWYNKDELENLGLPSPIKKILSKL